MYNSIIEKVLYMKYYELKKSLEGLNLKNEKTYKQVSIMFIPLMHKILRTSNGEEEILHYDIEQVIDEFMDKEREIIFFIDKFLRKYLEILDKDSESFLKRGIQFLAYNYYNEMVFYFDAFIALFSSVLEHEQKEALRKFFDNEVDQIYPNRKDVGLYWEINVLRNRIVHYTDKRYDNNRKICGCFLNFSSKINVINVDEMGNISIPSTLIDVYGNQIVKNAVKLAIESRFNVFDILFPKKSPKGYSKKAPVMLYPSGDIFFDYAKSLIRLLNEVELFFNNINNMFIKAFMSFYDNADELKKNKTSIFLGQKEISYSIGDVFDI